MIMWWGELRCIESRGFVSKRIARRLLHRHQVLFVVSMFQNYGGGIQVLSPRDVYLDTARQLNHFPEREWTPRSA
jgi:hypothetical protein